MTEKEQKEQREALIFNKGKINLLIGSLHDIMTYSPLVDEDKVISNLATAFHALSRSEILLEKKINKLDKKI